MFISLGPSGAAAPTSSVELHRRKKLIRKIAETKTVWVSKEEKVWQHQSCPQNRIVSVFLRTLEKQIQSFWKIQYPIRASLSLRSSNLTNIVEVCSTNETKPQYPHLVHTYF
ncbi:hypothetical protein TNCV_3165551 [Trichonephila clavipes]|nr:hypothetical protein TNCV_3165551 [Trichonephila clavipes]